MSDSIKELATALVKVQGALPQITKDKTAQGAQFSYDYVSLDTVMPAALAILGKHGIAITQTPGTAEDGGSNLSTTLLHVSGEWLSDTQPLLITKQDAQGQGSAITYARRYGLMAILGIVADEDDDGTAASKKPATRRKAATKTAGNGKASVQEDHVGKAPPQQIAFIKRLLDDWKGGDEQAACEAVQKIMPNAVNENATALALETLNQVEATKLVAGIQAARQPKPRQRSATEEGT